MVPKTTTNQTEHIMSDDSKDTLTIIIEDGNLTLVKKFFMEDTPGQDYLRRAVELYLIKKTPKNPSEDRFKIIEYIFEKSDRISMEFLEMALFFGDLPLLKMFIDAGAQTENVRLGVFGHSMGMGHKEACELAWASSKIRTHLLTQGPNEVLH